MKTPLKGLGLGESLRAGQSHTSLVSYLPQCAVCATVSVLLSLHPFCVVQMKTQRSGSCNPLPYVVVLKSADYKFYSS